ncbi:hypothetical protein MBANPS3_005084 [Mucor bainieri]
MYDRARVRIERANAVDAAEAEELIFDHQFDSIKVESFFDNTYYTLEIDVVKGFLSSCSCHDYQRYESACKHMYLVNRIKGIPLSKEDAYPLMTEEERKQELAVEFEDAFNGLTQFSQEFQTFMSKEFRKENYSNVSDGPFLSRVLAEMCQGLDRLKALNRNYR